MSEHKPKLIVDVDGFIAGPKPTSGYENCDANGPALERLRELQALGWEVAVHTSRNVRTLDHNPGKIAVQTMPKLLRWLDENGLQPDEAWSKPWSGSIGFYVDDRSVRPSEFKNLRPNEILNVVQGEAFTFATPSWRVGSSQSWRIIDLRQDVSSLYDGRLDATISELRDEGFRSYVILPASCELARGVMESLLRGGATWTRLGPHARRMTAVDELVARGEASYGSSSITPQDAPPQPTVLSSRHFNRVARVADGIVEKTSHDPKLKFELAWLNSVEHLKIAPVARPIENGYATHYFPGGTLADLLDRRTLRDEELDLLNAKLTQLWDQPKPTGDCDFKDLHERLVVRKSWLRARELEGLLDGIMGARRNDTWLVNGERCGTIPGTVDLLIGVIDEPTEADVGFWHGDFYPSNILLSERWGQPAPVELLLIDPRGTVDGKTVALIGDRRYDLGKLAHSLRWGYDAITRGWRDVAWRRDPQNATLLDVHLRVWDEGGTSPQRVQLWQRLILGRKIVSDDPKITAMAALQLITCAPLHSDDPKRVVALVARGMQAARLAFKKLGISR